MLVVDCRIAKNISKMAHLYWHECGVFGMIFRVQWHGVDQFVVCITHFWTG